MRLAAASAAQRENGAPPVGVETAAGEERHQRHHARNVDRRELDGQKHQPEARRIENGAARPEPLRRIRHAARPRSAIPRCARPPRATWSRRNGAATAAATIAAMMRAPRKRQRSARSVAKSSSGTATSALAAKAKPPIQVELSKPAAATSPSVMTVPRVATMRELRDQVDRHHRQRGRDDVLRHPGRLEQKAGEAGRTRQHGVDVLRAEQVPQQIARGCGRREQHRKRRRRCASGEPQRQAHHRRERSEGGKPGQPGIGLPAAAPEEPRDLRRAEMPEIVIGERPPPIGEERIARRQAEPRHVVDQRDLGVIENGIGEKGRIAGKFWQHRGSRHHRQQHCEPIAPTGEPHRRLLRGRRRDAGRRNDGSREDKHGHRRNRGRRERHEGEHRQRECAVYGKADGGRERQGEPRRNEAARQRKAEAGPEQCRDRGTENGAGDRCHRGKLCCRPNGIESSRLPRLAEIRVSPGRPRRPGLAPAP